MKKTFILFATVLTSFATFAQAELTNAFRANEDKNYEEALNYINQASSNPKATSKEKYWRYRGDIYMNIATDSVLSMKYANSFNEALASYTKAIELSKDWLVEIAAYVLKGRINEEEKALAAYKAKDVCGAAMYYENLASSGKLIGLTDSVFYLYAGMFNEECGKFDKAISNYSYCIELNYQPAECYSKLGNALVKSGKKEEAIRILGEARKKFPKNSSLLRSEVNIYIEDKDYKKANDLLIALAEADPKNESVLFVLGVTYERDEKLQEAENVYIKAIELNPAYYDARYNLARLFYNKGVEKSNYCNNEIPLKETAKFEACKVEKRQIFATAAEHFRVCYDQNNQDPQLKKVLTECYRKSDQEAKISELK